MSEPREETRRLGNVWLHGSSDDVRKAPNETRGRLDQDKRLFNPHRNFFGTPGRRRNTFLEGA